MNYVKLLVTLAVLTLVVAVVGFAGAAKGHAVTPKTTQSVGKVNFQQPVFKGVEADDQPAKSGRRTIAIGEAVARPIPKIDKAMAKTMGITSGLSGLYHIPGDFPTIGAAVAVLNFVGLSGNTTFELDAASYLEPTAVTFGTFAGAGTYTLTVQPQAGLAVTVNFLSSNTNGKGFAFNGASGVTIDGSTGSLLLQFSNLSTFPLGDPNGATVYITGASDHIAVKNTQIHGYVNNAVWANQTEGRPGVFVWTATADPSFSSFITLDHDTITGATYGIKVLSETNVVSVDVLNITNCRIGGAWGDPVVMGGWYEYSAGVNFSNTITDGVTFLDWYFENAYTENDNDVVFGAGQIMFNFGYTTGHYFALTDGSVFHDNVIRNVGNDIPDGYLGLYAVRVYDSNLGLNIASKVYNNRIYSVKGVSGLLVGFRGPINGLFAHNSIQLSGPSNGHTTTTCVNTTGTQENNALENTITGLTAANTRAITNSGTVDYNALNAPTPVVGYTTEGLAAGAGFNVHGTSGAINFTGDLHLNAAGPSVAQYAGGPHVLAGTDIDGVVRDTTIAGTRDAGASQTTAPLGSTPGADVSVGTIIAPNSGGVPAGLPVAPVVVVKNNTVAATGSFNVSVTISDGYSQTVSTSLPGSGEATVTFPNWTPATGSYTITATVALAGDVNPANDTYSRAQTVQAPVTITSDTTYTWESGTQGWSMTNDFVRSNSFTKLGGPVSGYAMITNRPNLASTYTEGAYANTQGYAATYPGPNLLISPWFNLSALTTDVYVSFQHSIKVEPGWDGSWVEYTTDGTHWKHLGALNDSHGINWYAQSVYANALSETGNPLDTLTMQLSTYLMYGPGTPNPTLPIAFWTSNGNPAGPTDVNTVEDAPLGPFGWIFTQLHITAANYPDIVGAPLVKFRYVAFSDAATAYEGWAVDNFHVGAHGSTFSGDTVNCTYYNDVNGNGLNDDASPRSGQKVYLSYFGVLKDSAVTDVNGNVQFVTAADNGGLPGTYNLTVKLPAGYVITSALANVSAPGNGSNLSTAIGIYQGGITGTIVNDLNDNGAKDLGEAGIQYFTVNVRKDSATGALVGTTVSDASGNYSVTLGPGTYYVSEVVAAGYRETFAGPNAGKTVDTVTISGASGSGTAIVANVNFGNFKLAVLRIEATIDINGNGVDDGAGDHTPLPTGAMLVYEITKDGSHLLYDTLGNGLAVRTHILDTAVYAVSLVSTPANWYPTLVKNVPLNETTSGQIDSVGYLFFRTISVSGSAYEDLNGNGVQDLGEPALAGLTVSLSGSVLGGNTAVTDVSGNWSIDSVGGGAHVISQTTPAGWTETAPVAGTFSFTSNYITGNISGKVFGNFHNVTVAGTTYRDRNDNGTDDAGDNGLSGITMTITGTGGTTTPTDANGNYTFTNIGPGAHTVTQTLQAGYTQTQPVTPGYTFTAASHTNLTGINFGSFQTSDGAQLYVTFGSAWWNHFGANPKPIKPAKAGKPYIAPVDANMVAYLFAGGNPSNSVIIGLSGQLNDGGKEKAYVLPSKYTDVAATFLSKGVYHNPNKFRGLDFGNTSKDLLKKYKSMPATVQSNDCVEEMMGLALNIALSNAGITPAGLSLLKYYDPSDATYNGLTVGQIKAHGDSIMTNWEFHTMTEYQALATVAAKINNAFYCDSANCSTYHTVIWDTAQFSGSSKVIVRAGQGYAVVSVPYLRPSTGVTPTITPIVPSALPKVYALYQNYPNPFNPTTSIDFDLPVSANVTLKVYNLLGQEVATLLNHQSVDAGNTSMTFDASAMASGVYLYRIVAEVQNSNGTTSQAFTQVKKMVLVK